MTDQTDQKETDRMSGPIRAADVQATPVEFLWNNRIPKGMITTVAGRPNQGKGLFAAHVAAAVSAAGGKVLYSAAEDSHGHMTKPRLEAAGANLSNVLLWRFAMPDQLVELADIVRDCRSASERKQGGDPVPIDLLVMDPFASHLSRGISRHSDNVRQVLGPLTKLIESTGTAVLIIEHALKRAMKNSHPLSVIGGSGSGLPAASRAAYLLGVDPDDDERILLAQAKFNIGAPPLTLAFQKDETEVDVGYMPMLIVDEELATFDPMRLFEDGKNGPIGRPPDKRAAACEWLTTYLAQAGRPVRSSTIQEDAKQHAMSSKTLRRAADDMGIVKNPPGGGRNCTWDLPDHVKTLMGVPVAPTPTPTEEPTAEQPTAEPDLTITDEMLAELLGGEEGTDDSA